MTQMPGSPDDFSTVSAPTPPTAPTAPAAPTASPVSFSSYGTAPTPPPLAPHHQPESQRRKKPARTLAGVAIAVVFIALKLAIAFGAGHLLSHGSGPAIGIVLVVLIVLGFLTRFMRL